MFKWLKRSAPPANGTQGASSSKSGRSPARSASGKRAGGSAEPAAPAPLPEVVAEGNTQADWSVWEDSMTALDSQLQGLVPTDRVYVRDTRPSQLTELDPFASVRRKRDI
jgi:hypothetical protein